jgi:hypothetical protein
MYDREDVNKRIYYVIMADRIQKCRQWEREAEKFVLARNLELDNWVAGLFAYLYLYHIT